MSILSRWRARAEQRVSLLEGNVPLTSNILLSLFGGRETDAGVSVTTEKALGLTSVWRAISLLAGAVAGSPLNEYDPDGNIVPNRLLESPHPLYTDVELLELVVVHLLTEGNAYLRLQGAGTMSNQIEGLLPINPRKVTPVWVVDERRQWVQERAYRVRLMDGSEVLLGEEDVLHIPGLSFDGLMGYAPIEVAAQALGVNLAAEKYAARLWGSGSLMSVILQNDKRLDKTQADALKERWQAKMAGLDHSHEVAILDSGAKFESLTIPPEQAQFIQAREFGVREVARIFGVPPHLLMDMGAASNWGTGLEQQNMGLGLFSIRPWTKRIGARYTRALARPNNSIRFNTSELTLADTRTRFSAHLLARKAQIMSIDEIRQVEKLPPIGTPESGDPLYVTGAAPFGEAGAAEPGANEGEPAATDQAGAAVGDAAVLANADEKYLDATGLAVLLQKMYLAVGVVITAEEAREIVRKAGGDLASVLSVEVPDELVKSSAPAVPVPAPMPDEAPPDEEPADDQDAES